MVSYDSRLRILLEDEVLPWLEVAFRGNYSSEQSGEFISPERSF